MQKFQLARLATLKTITAETPVSLDAIEVTSNDQLRVQDTLCTAIAKFAGFCATHSRPSEFQVRITL